MSTMQLANRPKTPGFHFLRTQEYRIAAAVNRPEPRMYGQQGGYVPPRRLSVGRDSKTATSSLTMNRLNLPPVPVEFESIRIAR